MGVVGMGVFAKNWLRIGAGGLAAMALSACELSLPDALVAAPDVPTDVARQKAPQRVSLPAAGLAVQGPSGYCVDTRSVQDDAEGGFVLLTSCAALAGRKNTGKTAVLSLSATGQSLGAFDFDAGAFARFFASEAGRAALARNGQASSVEVLETVERADRLLIHAKDAAPNPVPGLTEEYWRAIYLKDGRLVTLTATPLADAPMDEAALRRLLEKFVAKNS